MERTNARKPFSIPEQVDIVVADVSFISLLAVLPESLRHLKPGGECVALLKPQFEARRDDFAPTECRANALAYAPERFRAEFTAFVEQAREAWLAPPVPVPSEWEHANGRNGTPHIIAQAPAPTPVVEPGYERVARMSDPAV